MTDAVQIRASAEQTRLWEAHQGIHWVRQSPFSVSFTLFVQECGQLMR